MWLVERGIKVEHGPAAAFAMPATPKMPVHEAWEHLGVLPTASKGEIRRAFRKRIREVHPDVTGDDGTLLQKVRDAFAVVETLENPAVWDQEGIEDGLPAWAAGLLNGVQWSDECPNYVAFLAKPDAKALAVGEMNERTGIRPWAAAWGKFSQQAANAEALRVCRQYSERCRLIYVGSGSARQKKPVNPTAGSDERRWWADSFVGGGDTPGFGWMPLINPEKEEVVGYKTIDASDVNGSPERVRVPVFRAKTGGLPYYYSPLKPKERTYMRKQNFKHAQPMTMKRWKNDRRYRQLLEMQQNNQW